jgi:hypothetical protein
VSWVELDHDVEMQEAQPVIADADFTARLRALEDSLGPIA